MHLRARRAGAVGTLLSLLVLLSALPAPAAGARSTRLAEPVGGIDIDAVVTDLSHDHVAVVGTVSEPTEAWAAVVGAARSDHLNLSLVVLRHPPEGATPTDVADAVLGQVKGTVLVLGPANSDGHTVGLASNDVGQAEVDQVVADIDGSAPTPATAQRVVDELTDAGFPWLIVVVGALIVVLCSGVAWGLWRRRQHRPDTVGAADELVVWLRAQLADILDRLDALAEPVQGTHRDDLHGRFQAAVAEGGAISTELGHEPMGRSRVDALAGRVAALRDDVSILQVGVDAMPTDRPDGP